MKVILKVALPFGGKAFRMLTFLDNFIILRVFKEIRQPLPLWFAFRNFGKPENGYRYEYCRIYNTREKTEKDVNNDLKKVDFFFSI